MLLAAMRLAAPLAMALAVVDVGGGPERGLVELEVVGVLPVDPQAASMLVLREKHGSALLPMFVSRPEGAALDVRLREGGDGHPRPMELTGQAIAALGGRVQRVELRVRGEALLSALVTLAQGERRTEVEARAPDAVALAMIWRAPILAGPEVLRRAGLTPDEIRRLRQPDREAQDPARGLGREQRL